MKIRKHVRSGARVVCPEPHHFYVLYFPPNSCIVNLIPKAAVLGSSWEERSGHETWPREWICYWGHTRVSYHE